MKATSAVLKKFTNSKTVHDLGRCILQLGRTVDPVGLDSRVQWLLITSASMSVRCSWHWGLAFFVIASKKDLQSTIAMLGCVSCHTFSGVCQAMLGFLIRSQEGSIKFGSRDGDLGTFEGRQKLYHTLSYFNENSFRCLLVVRLAWWRWNQFNASSTGDASLGR